MSHHGIHPGGGDAGESSDEEEFLYTSTSPIERPMENIPQTSTDVHENHASDSEEEVFSYPNPSLSSPRVAQPEANVQRPTLVQLEALYNSAVSGEISTLQQLFRTALESSNIEAFALANDASSRTGLTALHAAASRGHLEMVKWR